MPRQYELITNISIMALRVHVTKVKVANYDVPLCWLSKMAHCGANKKVPKPECRNCEISVRHIIGHITVAAAFTRQS
jgi:hypothetical protein